MGYLHVPNLYKDQRILAFKWIFACEKLHGTSAHISWKDGKVGFFSGGESYENFVRLFDIDALTAKLTARFQPEMPVTIFGEAYGGKQQGMSLTYGKALKFAAFDIKVDKTWLGVPNAAELADHLGLEFVDYRLVYTSLEEIDAERDKPSTQAIRNGILEPKIREGVVLRPPFEVTLSNGDRVIAKHKRAEFSERGKAHVELDPSKRELLLAAGAIALEWVTPMRLEHVIDKLLSQRDNKELEMKDIPVVCRAMIEDVTREAAGEIVDSKPAQKAISQRTVDLFKVRMRSNAFSLQPQVPADNLLGAVLQSGENLDTLVPSDVGNVG